jgi:integrase
MQMSLVERFMERLPASRRKPFMKLLRLWCGGADADGFLDRCKHDQEFLNDSIVDLVERLKAEGLAPKTITSFYLVFLKRFLRFCGLKPDWDIIRARCSIPRSRVVRVDRAPSISELRHMILAAPPRLGLMIHLAAVTGLRIHELLNLKVENLDFTCDPPVLRIVSAKTGRVREVPLTREIVQRLVKYLGDRRSGPLFTSRDGGKLDERNLQRDFINLTLKLGINQRDPSGRGWMLHPYSLRKFFKTRLEEAGVNSLIIETWMGHDLNVSGAYFRPSRKMILEEWKKAERALTIFAEEDEDKAIENIRRIEELEAEIAEMKRALSHLLTRLRESHNRLGASSGL